MDAPTSSPLGLIVFFYIYIFVVGVLEWVGELVTSRKWLIGLLAIILLFVTLSLHAEVVMTKRRLREMHQRIRIMRQSIRVMRRSVKKLRARKT